MPSRAVVISFIMAEACVLEAAKTVTSSAYAKSVILSSGCCGSSSAPHPFSLHLVTKGGGEDTLQADSGHSISGEVGRPPHGRVVVVPRCINLLVTAILLATCIMDQRVRHRVQVRHVQGGLLI